jgi:hypothetical protein
VVVSTKMGSSCCCLIVLSLFSFDCPPLDAAPASPFIASKGRARVIFYGKVVKIGKMKEKGKKGGLGRSRPPPYPVGAVFL